MDPIVCLCHSKPRFGLFRPVALQAAVLIKASRSVLLAHARNSQIAIVLEATDTDGRSLLASAAEGGNPKTVKTVVDILGGEVRAHTGVIVYVYGAVHQNEGKQNGLL